MNIATQDIIKMIPFDQEGVFGPAATLAMKVEERSNDLLGAVSKLEAFSLYVKDKFTEFAHVKPKGRKEFCAQVLKEPLSLDELLKTRFYQSMQKIEVPPFHETVIKAVGRPMLETVEESFPKKKFNESEEKSFQEWMARLVEMYLPESSLREQCVIYETLGDAKAKVVIVRPS